MKRQLAKWLASKDKDYGIGCRIHTALNVDPSHLKYLNSGKSTVHAAILLQDLQRYARIHRIKIAPAAAPKTPVIVPPKEGGIVFEGTLPVDEGKRFYIVKSNKVMYDALSEELQLAYDENMNRLGEFNRLSAALRAVPEGEQNNVRRKEYIDQIVPLRDKIREVFDVIDNALKGIEPPKEEITEASGKYTKEQIDTITDPVLQEQCKAKRIDTNLKYLRTNKMATKESALKQIALRKSELDAWNVKYEFNEITEGTK